MTLDYPVTDVKGLMKDRYEKWMTTEQLAKKHFVSVHTIQRCLKKYSAMFGYTEPMHHYRLQTIRNEYANGMKPKEIMEKYGLNQTVVYEYIYNKVNGGKPEIKKGLGNP